jgi:hypothetical protein
VRYGLKPPSSNPWPALRKRRIVKRASGQFIHILMEFANPIRLFDLRQHHCRWPVAGDGAAVLFCGANKYGDHPYCVGHCHMAYSSLGSRAAEKQRWLQWQRNRAA